MYFFITEVIHFYVMIKGNWEKYNIFSHTVIWKLWVLSSPPSFCVLFLLPSLINIRPLEFFLNWCILKNPRRWSKKTQDVMVKNVGWILRSPLRDARRSPAGNITLVALVCKASWSYLILKHFISCNVYRHPQNCSEYTALKLLLTHEKWE